MARRTIRTCAVGTAVCVVLALFIGVACAAARQLAENTFTQTQSLIQTDRCNREVKGSDEADPTIDASWPVVAHLATVSTDVLMDPALCEAERAWLTERSVALQTRMQLVETTMQGMRAMFGLTELPLSRIVVRREKQVGIAMIGQGYIRIDVKFFDPSGNNAYTMDVLRGVIIHELAHMIDYPKGITRQDGYVAAWKGLTCAEAHAIAESKMIPELMTGHPWSNERELFASTIEVITHPNWSKHVRELPAPVRGVHLRVLQATRVALQNAQFDPDAPIMRIIDARIAALKRWSKRDAP